jgi:hypothetical protein
VWVVGSLAYANIISDPPANNKGHDINITNIVILWIEMDYQKK